MDRKELAEKIGGIKRSSLDCPNCDNSGCIPVQISEEDFEVEQCEFCFCNPLSVFNEPKRVDDYIIKEIAKAKRDVAEEILEEDGNIAKINKCLVIIADNKV